MRRVFYIVSVALFASCIGNTSIDRQAVLERNNPCVTSFDSLSSLTVGNGGFAFTVDATGLQTFSDHYSQGIPLGTMSDWGWYSALDTVGIRVEDAYVADSRANNKNKETYSEQPPLSDASRWLIDNPRRLSLGSIGFCLPELVTPDSIKSCSQTLDLYSGVVRSRFFFRENSYEVTTLCHPDSDIVAVKVESAVPLPVRFNFSCTEATDNRTLLLSGQPSMVILKRIVNATSYYVKISWNGDGVFSRDSLFNSFVFVPDSGHFELCCQFYPEDRLSLHGIALSFNSCYSRCVASWHRYWDKGGIVDFSECTDDRAKELERRVVLSQYIMAVQDAANSPMQETGLSYNQASGKFRLESQWWLLAHFALWGHPEKLENTLNWYLSAESAAKAFAVKQNYRGVRWMGITDPSARETPFDVDNYMIIQQPLFIYMAELLYRANPSDEILNKYCGLVEETAEFMASYVIYNPDTRYYELNGMIPTQNSIRFDSVSNPAFEVAAWRYALSVAQKWHRRVETKKIALWSNIVKDLTPLSYDESSNYLPASNVHTAYSDVIYMTGHPSVLGVSGLLPSSSFVDAPKMTATLNSVWNNWQWNTTYGTDFALTAMCAARTGNRNMAVDALLKDEPSNTYLNNGHNYQNHVYRTYLPGNGGLLSAVAMMCAGWRGSWGVNPGFPNDGTWKVKWENLKPLP